MDDSLAEAAPADVASDDIAPSEVEDVPSSTKTDVLDSDETAVHSLTENGDLAETETSQMEMGSSEAEDVNFLEEDEAVTSNRSEGAHPGDDGDFKNVEEKQGGDLTLEEVDNAESGPTESEIAVDPEEGGNLVQEEEASLAEIDDGAKAEDIATGAEGATTDMEENEGDSQEINATSSNEDTGGDEELSVNDSGVEDVEAVESSAETPVEVEETPEAEDGLTRDLDVQTDAEETKEAVTDEQDVTVPEVEPAEEPLAVESESEVESVEELPVEANIEAESSSLVPPTDSIESSLQDSVDEVEADETRDVDTSEQDVPTLDTEKASEEQASESTGDTELPHPADAAESSPRELEAEEWVTVDTNVEDAASLDVDVTGEEAVEESSSANDKGEAEGTPDVVTGVEVGPISDAETAEENVVETEVETEAPSPLPVDAEESSPTVTADTDGQEARELAEVVSNEEEAPTSGDGNEAETEEILEAVQEDQDAPPPSVTGEEEEQASGLECEGDALSPTVENVEDSDEKREIELDPNIAEAESSEVNSSVDDVPGNAEFEVSAMEDAALLDPKSMSDLETSATADVTELEETDIIEDSTKTEDSDFEVVRAEPYDSATEVEVVETEQFPEIEASEHGEKVDSSEQVEDSSHAEILDAEDAPTAPEDPPSQSETDSTAETEATPVETEESEGREIPGIALLQAIAEENLIPTADHEKVTANIEDHGDSAGRSDPSATSSSEEFPEGKGSLLNDQCAHVLQARQEGTSLPDPPSARDTAEEDIRSLSEANVAAKMKMDFLIDKENEMLKNQSFSNTRTHAPETSISAADGGASASTTSSLYIETGSVQKDEASVPLSTYTGDLNSSWAAALREGANDVSEQQMPRLRALAHAGDRRGSMTDGDRPSASKEIGRQSEDSSAVRFPLSIMLWCSQSMSSLFGSSKSL
ncbi:hypothetical protein R1flu_029207 [Riccia fluitans]|uniref:Uncharacterized protein n=1 Tax=Riccia fluitans TaxID=41844 RepID=A0ABD1XPE1_9MARC